MPKNPEKEEKYVTQSQWTEGMEMIKDYFGQLFNELHEFKKDQGNTNERLEKKIDVNTDSLSILTVELREVKSVEFQVYNHEKRIEKLEKAQ